MKPFLIFQFFFCAFVNAQVTSLNCINALPITSGYTVTLFMNTGFGTINDLPAPSNISNPTVNPVSNNQGCMLAGEYEPGWYVFKICNTGLLQFVIGGSNGPFPQMSYYDWALWKYSPNTCAKIHNNQLPPLRCNWNGIDAGGTGICDTLNLPPNGVKYNYEPPLPVNAGDTLLLCFSNYSNVNYYMDLVSIGTSSICQNLITGLPATETLKQKAFVYNNSIKQIKILDNALTSFIIYDMQGKIIYTANDEKEIINCATFLSGVYFISYSKENNLPVTEKILVN